MTFDRRRFRFGSLAAGAAAAADPAPASVPEDKREQLCSTAISREQEAKVLAAWKARK